MLSGNYRPFLCATSLPANHDPERGFYLNCHHELVTCQVHHLNLEFFSTICCYLPESEVVFHNIAFDWCVNFMTFMISALRYKSHALLHTLQIVPSVFGSFRLSILQQSIGLIALSVQLRFLSFCFLHFLSFVYFSDFEVKPYIFQASSPLFDTAPPSNSSVIEYDEITRSLSEVVDSTTQEGKTERGISDQWARYVLSNQSA